LVKIKTMLAKRTEAALMLLLGLTMDITPWEVTPLAIANSKMNWVVSSMPLQFGPPISRKFYAIIHPRVH
jgi:hypothetical protein